MGNQLCTKYWKVPNNYDRDYSLSFSAVSNLCHFWCVTVLDFSLSLGKKRSLPGLWRYVNEWRGFSFQPIFICVSDTVTTITIINARICLLFSQLLPFFFISFQNIFVNAKHLDTYYYVHAWSKKFNSPLLSFWKTEVHGLNLRFLNVESVSRPLRPWERSKSMQFTISIKNLCPFFANDGF